MHETVHAKLPRGGVPGSAWTLGARQEARGSRFAYRTNVNGTVNHQKVIARVASPAAVSAQSCQPAGSVVSTVFVSV
jgi:hypothetical protein